MIRILIFQLFIRCTLSFISSPISSSNHLSLRQLHHAVFIENDDLYKRLEQRLGDRDDAEEERRLNLQAVEEEEEIKPGSNALVIGIISSVFLGVIAGAGVGRKLLIDRRAREELELASVAQAAQTEARRLLLEAQDATRILKEAQQSDAPTLTQPTAFAILSWFKQRREKNKREELMSIAQSKQALAEEALIVAEKTLQLTALDLQVVDRLETAEAAYQYELDLMQQISQMTSEPVLIQEAQERVDVAKAEFDAAQEQALQLARSIVESKDSILAQLNTDSAFATLLTGLFDQPLTLPEDENKDSKSSSLLDDEAANLLESSSQSQQEESSPEQQPQLHQDEK